MKRYNPFKPQPSALPLKLHLLADHPNSFFTEETAEFAEAFNADIHYLQQISRQYSAADCPTDTHFRAQLDQLMQEMATASEASGPANRLGRG